MAVFRRNAVETTRYLLLLYFYVLVDILQNDNFFIQYNTRPYRSPNGVSNVLIYNDLFKQVWPFVV
jgi:hypothetical protein